jgi:hypothetical protein
MRISRSQSDSPSEAKYLAFCEWLSIWLEWWSRRMARSMNVCPQLGEQWLDFPSDEMKLYLRSPPHAPPHGFLSLLGWPTRTSGKILACSSRIQPRQDLGYGVLKEAFAFLAQFWVTEEIGLLPNSVFLLSSVFASRQEKIYALR